MILSIPFATFAALLRLEPYLKALPLDLVMGRALQGHQPIEGTAFLHLLEAPVPLWKLGVSDAESRLAFLLGVHPALFLAQRTASAVRASRQGLSDCERAKPLAPIRWMLRLGLSFTQ